MRKQVRMRGAWQLRGVDSEFDKGFGRGVTWTSLQYIPGCSVYLAVGRGMSDSMATVR